MTTVQNLGEQLSASSLVASVDYNVLRSGARFVTEHFPLYLDEHGIAGLDRQRRKAASAWKNWRKSF